MASSQSHVGSRVRVAGEPARALRFDASFVIYEWLTNEDFLVRALVPEATLITASMDDSLEGVLEKLPSEPSSFALHLNCTLTSGFPRCRPELLDTLLARNVNILNAGAIDITKRTIQQTCLNLRLGTTLATPLGDPSEQVIVKTNLNFAGASEWALSKEERMELGLGEGTTLIWDPGQYKVVRRDQVEESWWGNENLICERFVENREHLWYRAYLLGDRTVICELQSEFAIKKVGSSGIRRVWRFVERANRTEEVDGLPYPAEMIAASRQLAHGLHLDFGTIDMVRDDADQFFVIDVNTTPAYLNRVPGLVEHLRPARI